MSPRFSNIKLRDFRKFLVRMGCMHARTTGGHEHWHKPGLRRSITFQTHEDPIPERVLRVNLRALAKDREEFMAIIADL